MISFQIIIIYHLIRYLSISSNPIQLRQTEQKERVPATYILSLGFIGKLILILRFPRRVKARDYRIHKRASYVLSIKNQNDQEGRKLLWCHSLYNPHSTGRASLIGTIRSPLFSSSLNERILPKGIMKKLIAVLLTHSSGSASREQPRGIGIAPFLVRRLIAPCYT